MIRHDIWHHYNNNQSTPGEKTHKDVKIRKLTELHLIGLSHDWIILPLIVFNLTSSKFAALNSMLTLLIIANLEIFSHENSPAIWRYVVFI